PTWQTGPKPGSGSPQETDSANRTGQRCQLSLGKQKLASRVIRGGRTSLSHS
ncbi:hypothetical protein P7K49_028520, partial [Saguinus oedipus]